MKSNKLHSPDDNNCKVFMKKAKVEYENWETIDYGKKKNISKFYTDRKLPVVTSSKWINETSRSVVDKGDPSTLQKLIKELSFEASQGPVVMEGEAVNFFDLSMQSLRWKGRCRLKV